tara:strand:- start:712 stop:1071 length:360 start_codon:yes stop_codon:yes gene_type:complete
LKLIISFNITFILKKKYIELLDKRGDSMLKKMLLIASMGFLLSGCFVAPIALIGPATSGFSTASIIQAGVSSGANYMVKKSTGSTISEHAINAINKDVLSQTYLPKNMNDDSLASIVAP